MLIFGSIPTHYLLRTRGPIAEGIWVNIAGASLLIAYFVPVSATFRVILLVFGLISIIIGAVMSIQKYKNL
ncbi:MAG: hypothetical protein HN757_00610 [Calditrichaeota bacterium]|nr:hypothetical protein [Calditrichota bacterium]